MADNNKNDEKIEIKDLKSDSISIEDSSNNATSDVSSGKAGSNSVTKKKLNSIKGPSSKNTNSNNNTSNDNSTGEIKDSKDSSKKNKNLKEKNKNEDPEEEKRKAEELFKDNPEQKKLDKKDPPQKQGEGKSSLPDAKAGEQVPQANGKIGNAINRGRSKYNEAKNNINSLANAPKEAVERSKKAVERKTKEVAEKAIRQLANAAKKAIKAAAKALVKAIAANPMFWVVVAIVLAIIIICVIINEILAGDAAESDLEATVTTIESMQEAINNGELAGEINQVNEASTLYDSYGSYLGYTKEQVEYIYNNAIDTTDLDDSSTRYYLIQLYQEKYGTGDTDGSDSILRATDYRELYKHILFTEKYNFNEIEWVNYSHDQDESRVLTSSDMIIDSDLGVQYPADSATDYEDFMDLVSPYLLSNYIPLSFLVSNVTAATGDVFSTGMKSNQQILQELVDSGYISEASLADVLDNEDSLAYQIILNCLSDITVNQYQLEHYYLDTYYLDYDIINYHETFTVQKIERDYTVEVPYTITTILGETFTYTRTETRHEVTYVYNNDLTTVQENTEPDHNNTRWNDQKEEDVMNETYVSNYTIDEIVYYVKQALCFDVEINNSYNYIKYSDNDAANRTNANSESSIESDYYQNLNEENVITSVSTISSDADMSNYGTVVASPSTQNGEYTYTTYTITGNTYTIYDGIRVDVNREWHDEVTAANSESTALTVSNITEFNNDYDYDEGQTPISEEEFKASDDYSYYENLATDKELNLIDVMDSNYYIYTNYVEAGNAQSTYIGLGRDNVYVSTTYGSLLNKYLDSIADDNKLNYVWGSSLGYDTSSPSSSTSGSSSYGSSYSLLKQLLHEFEGGGTVYQNSEGVDCYKAYNDSSGYLTVGYGINLSSHSDWKSQLESLIGTTITEGTLVPCEYVDAIEDEFINAKLTSIKALLASNSIELKEYQIHALLIRLYNVGNVNAFPSAYNSYYVESVDDKYEEVYEQYGSTPESVTAITSCADLGSALYNNYMSTPVTSSGEVLQGLVTRRKEEYYLFSLGYYTHNNFHAFYTEGLSFNGIQCVNSDGSIDLDAVYELQTALEDSVFDGKIHAGIPSLSNPWGSKVSTNTTDNTDNLGYLSSNYSSFFATSYYYQCPWWSRGRANIYLNSVDPDTFSGTFIRDGLGNGNVLAQNVASAYGVTYYTDISQITANCIISWNHGSYGHTAYVEAVGDDYIVISHCGSGVAWHGVTIVSKSTGNISSSYTFAGFVKMDDIVAKYSGK